MKWIIFTLITALLSVGGANAGGDVAKCIRHDYGIPSAVSNATMFANCEIKLLAAGQKLCAQAQKDCTGMTENDFTDLAVFNGMQPQEVEATGKAAAREAQGMCDTARINGVSQSGHNLAGIPTAMYLYIYERNNNTKGPMRWGTGFVCVKQK